LIELDFQKRQVVIGSLVEYSIYMDWTKR
jgi:hypothetical protein